MCIFITNVFYSSCFDIVVTQSSAKMSQSFAKKQITTSSPKYPLLSGSQRYYYYAKISQSFAKNNITSSSPKYPPLRGSLRYLRGSLRYNYYAKFRKEKYHVIHPTFHFSIFPPIHLSTFPTFHVYLAPCPYIRISSGFTSSRSLNGSCSTCPLLFSSTRATAYR